MPTTATQTAAPAAAIFDLDGTLVDTLEDIAISGNHSLALHGLPPRPTEDYRRLAGQGVENMYRGASGKDDPELLASLIEAHFEHYNAHHMDHSRPFPGVVEALATLRDAGLPMGVLSNKRHGPAVEQVAALFDDGLFAHVRGAQDGTPLKPDPEPLRRVCGAMGVDPARCVYVGDTAADMGAGVAAGCRTIGVTWGFRDEAELRVAGAGVIIDRVDELAPAILDAMR